jgi:hypothetical protein
MRSCWTPRKEWEAQSKEVAPFFPDFFPFSNGSSTHNVELHCRQRSTASSSQGKKKKKVLYPFFSLKKQNQENDEKGAAPTHISVL